MNYNILAYLIYGSITLYIIFWLGKYFHTNGKIFIIDLFHQQQTIANATNNMLLILYYLFNMGYTVIQFNYWESIHTLPILLSSLTQKIAILVLLLAILHYLNMLGIYLYAKNKFNHISSL
jgi:hypothetical protein